VIDLGFKGTGGAIGRYGPARISGLRVDRVANGVLLHPITTRWRLLNGLIVLPPEPELLRRLAQVLLETAVGIEQEEEGQLSS
jgi:hypothetical protein